MIGIIGAGKIAQEYARVLQEMNKEFVVIGRGEKSAKEFKNNIKADVLTGGIKKHWRLKLDYAIVAVDILETPKVVKDLIRMDVKNILIEKPGSLYKKDLLDLNALAFARGINIYIAYNRRFMSTIQTAKRFVNDNVESVYFSFDDNIKNLKHPRKVKNRWIIAQSSHLIDTVMFLMGNIEEIGACFDTRISGAPHDMWGIGKFKNGIEFRYDTNWDVIGKWKLKIYYKNGDKIILEPLERLRYKNKIYELDKIDRDFKPGFYRMVKSFLNYKDDLKTLIEQIEDFYLYEQMGGL
jgi:predicted dehydrogenase